MSSFNPDTSGTLVTGLVSYWKGENTNDSHSTNHWSLIGGAYSAGKINNAFSNTADNTGWEMGHTAALCPAAAISIAVWFNPTLNGTRYIDPIFGKRHANANGYWSYDLGTTYSGGNFIPFFGVNTSGAGMTQAVSSVALSPGTWYHLVGVYNGSTVKIYVNGIERGSAAVSGNISYNASYTHRLNRHNFANGEQSHGQSDEIGLWNKALSTTEISDLYNGGSGQTLLLSATYTRTIADSLMNGASRVSTLTRTLSSRRSMTDTIMNAASRFATLTALRSVLVTISDSMMNAVGRLATIAHGLAHVRAMSDTLMNAAGRTDSLSRIVSFVRTATDSLMNAAARLATLSRSAVSMMRTMSDSMMNSAGRFSFLKTFLNGLNSRYSAKDPRTGTTSYSETHPRRGTSYDKTYPDA